MTDRRSTPTPHGAAGVLVDRSRRPSVTLVLGHGAGGGTDARDLTALAKGLPPLGITVVRVEQPWRLAGRRLAPAARSLDESFVAVVDRLRPRTPLVVGGRSTGARVACRTAQWLGASGCVALAYPLHPPGQPEKSRVGELTGAGVPTLVVQGERDSWGSPVEFPSTLDLRVIVGADHGFSVLKSAPVSQQESLDNLVSAVSDWLTGRFG